MFLRSVILIALMLAVAPTACTAGIYVGMWEGVDTENVEVESDSFSSASTSNDSPQPSEVETRAALHSEQGTTGSSPTNNSSNPTVMNGWFQIHALFFNSKPPLESVFGLNEWQWIPDTPVCKIPKVPIS